MWARQEQKEPAGKFSVKPKNVLNPREHCELRFTAVLHYVCREHPTPQPARADATPRLFLPLAGKLSRYCFL